MSKSKRYLLVFTTILLVFTSTYLGLVLARQFEIEKKVAIMIALINAGIYLPGALIISFGLNSKAENFVMRFLSITTFQMIAAMSVMAAVIFVKYPNARMIVFHFLILFCLTLIVQTIMLVRAKNN